MKIKISVDDLRKGKYRPTNEDVITELSSQALSKEQTQAIAQFLYEVLIRSKEV